MDIIVCKDYNEVAEKAFKIFLEKYKSIPKPNIGFATGSSPLGLYEQIINDYKQGNTTYKNMITFNLDEYIGIDKGHPSSYYYAMKNTLFNHIDIPEENINFPSGMTNNIDEECIRYSNVLLEKPIDLQILGLGANGHIGFNEPGTKFKSTVHVIDLNDKTIEDNSRFFNSIEEMPKQAITMGIKEIMNVKEILLIATGQNKADAVAEMVCGEISESLPASVLQLHNNVTIIIDKFAASKLKHDVNNFLHYPQ